MCVHILTNGLTHAIAPFHGAWIHKQGITVVFAPNQLFEGDTHAKSRRSLSLHFATIKELRQNPVLSHVKASSMGRGQMTHSCKQLEDSDIPQSSIFHLGLERPPTGRQDQESETY
jgi:hypothetical protein